MTASEFKDEILPCYDTAYAVAMGIVHNSDDARDIVQELFRRLWEKHASLALPASSRSFCAVSTRNAALSWMRSNPPGRETVIDGQMSIPDDESDSHSQEDLLPEAISMLDSRHRELIRLSLAGEDNAEIAAKFSTTEVNIRVMLSRTRRQLRTILLSLQNKYY